MAARQVQHTFQTPEATGLLQRFLDLEDEVRTHYLAQPAVQPAPAQPPTYEFDNARLLSAVTYISGEGAAAGATVVAAAEQGRVADDLVRILRDHVAYESFQAADFAFAGLPPVVADLPVARAEEWAQIGVGTQTVDQGFAQHPAIAPAVHIPLDVATYFNLDPQGDGVAVRDALRQIPAQQQGQGQQNLQALGWRARLGSQLSSLVPRPSSSRERIAVYAGLGALALGALVGFGSYQGWSCGSSPIGPMAHLQPAGRLDAGSDATVGYSAAPDGAAGVSTAQHRDAGVSVPPVASGRLDAGAASAAAVSSPPAPRLDGGAVAQAATPIPPVVPGPVAPVGPPQLRPWSDGGVPNATPYTASTPAPRMDGGVPAGPSVVAPPYVAAPAAPVVPT